MASRSFVQSFYKIWELAPPTSEHLLLVRELSLHPITAQILYNRGYRTGSQALQFLQPSAERLRDRYLPGTEQCLQRLKTALQRKEKILIYGDSDVDGITGTAILVRYLKSLGLEVMYFVPPRSGRSYGIFPQLLPAAQSRNIPLIFTVDCGSEELQVSKTLQEAGIHLIVTDHHPARAPNPYAYLTLNPHLGGYPFPYLSGAGVAYKLSLCLQKELGGSVDGLLPLAALGTLADIMPLVEENRILCLHGLSELSSATSPPLSVLKEALGLTRQKVITEAEVMYKIAPVLNAAGRRDAPYLAVEFFLAQDASYASRLLHQLLQKNEERKEISRGILEEALEQAQEIASDQVAVFYSDAWSTGIISQIAGQLISILKRPVVVLAPQPDSDGIQGSARSPRFFPLKSAIQELAGDILTDIGGHTEAFGLSFPRHHLGAFLERLHHIPVNIIPDRICVDAELQPHDITPELWFHLAKLGPFGPLNSPPVFLLRQMKVLSAERVGTSGRHLRLLLGRAGKKFFAFYHYAGHRWKETLGKTLSVLFSLSRDFSTHRLSLDLQDMREGF